ncbi:MAG TPA: reverse transcriptase family protein, partial [Nitrososphaera sp.]|nr:reverse transcriptase family protein [Nitrososphaera sp.]
QSLRKAKALEERRINGELQSAMDRADLSLFWKRLNSVRGFYSKTQVATAMFDDSGVLQSDPVRTLAGWKRYFETIANAADDGDERARNENPLDSNFKSTIQRRLAQLVRERRSQPELDKPISMDELKKALLRLKRKGAAGPDEIPNSFLLMMGPVALDAMLNLFNRIWQSQTWPDKWREGLIVPLFKSGGARANMADYRPITLTSCVSKLFESVLLARLSLWCDNLQVLCEEQCGFRVGRSTLEQIFSLHEIIGMRREQKLKTWLAFLDCRRAYDRVWRDGLRYRLWQSGVQGHMFHFLSSMISSSTRRVVLAGQQSDEFETLIGLAQGTVLSPLLYAIFIDGLAQKLKAEGFGVDVFGRKVALLLYADDLVILAKDDPQLRRMLAVISEYATKWQFRFNTKPGKSNAVVTPASKKEFAVLQQELAKNPLRLGDGELHLSRNYKYLGVESGKTGKGCWNDYLSRVRRNAMLKVNQLTYAAGGKRSLYTKTLVYLFTSYVRPSLEYADAIWGAMVSQTGLEALEKVQAEFAKKILGLAKHPVAHEYLRSELGLPTMKSRVLASSLRFFGTLARMGPERLAGHIFHNRCKQVDRLVTESKNRMPKSSNSSKIPTGKHSWCVELRKLLTDNGCADVWEARSVPADWKRRVKLLVANSAQIERASELRQLSTLTLFRRLKIQFGIDDWMSRKISHPGAKIKIKLRSGCAPVMDRVGASNKVPKQLRTCPFCYTGQIETESHLVASCPFYSDLRSSCLAKIKTAAGLQVSRALDDAMKSSSEENLAELFLGNACLIGMRTEAREKVDNVILDYLKTLWRRRHLLWIQLCANCDEWSI